MFASKKKRAQCVLSKSHIIVIISYLALHCANYHSLCADGVSNVVDFFIPFLPLERRHIVQCIMVEMKAMGLEPEHEKACELADEILNYFPKDEKFFSVSGCKRIASRLRFLM